MSGKISKQDKEILALKKEFEKKEAELKALKSNVNKKYLTNLTITIGHSNTNLNVLDKIGLLDLLCKLKAIKTEADSIGISNIEVGRFTISDYIFDIILKLQNIDLIQREKDLKEYNETISSFISKDYKQNEFLSKAKEFLKK